MNSKEHIDFLTWNVRGLNHLIKRMKMLTHLGKIRCDVAFIQKTHLSAVEANNLQRDWVGGVVFAPAVGKTSGGCHPITQGTGGFYH